VLEAAGVSHRCTLVGVFLDSVPSGGDAYMLRRIIHDWDEGCALRILATTQYSPRDVRRWKAIAT